MDLRSRNCHFYERRDKEIKFSVSCLSNPKASIQILQDFLQVGKFCLPSKVQDFLDVLPCTLKRLLSDSHYICVKDLPQGTKISDFISVNVISIDPRGKCLLVRDLNSVGPRRLSISSTLRIKRPDVRGYYGVESSTVLLKQNFTLFIIVIIIVIIIIIIVIVIIMAQYREFVERKTILISASDS